MTPVSSCPTLARMDEKAIRRAALVTLQRAILERFPPGPERRAWLRWLATETEIASMRCA